MHDLGIAAMRGTVDLDHKMRLNRREIGDVRSDGMLPPEGSTMFRTQSQPRP
jgi:hypothetical protein